jgi:hydroxycarboxylate dehydrogenase B
MLINHQNLRGWVAEIIRRTGSHDDEAVLVADHLVAANLAGHDSHGVGLIPNYVRHFQAGLIKPNTPARLVTDDGAIMVFEGGRGYGRRVAGEAMAAAIERCRDTGVVLMGLRGPHHIGRVGAYGEIALAAGLVSIHFVNVTDHNPVVAPFGGADGRFVTNPVCVAVPGTENTPPVLLDMATSKIAVGKARVAMMRGDQLADGIALDPAGKPTTDPAALFGSPRGALLPFGAHKGSGLALICELLAGVLTGGGTIQPENPRHGGVVNHMLTILVDPARLVDLDWMRAEIDATIAYVKASPPADPAKPVLTAGDPERAARAARTRDGITIEDATWEDMLEAGEKLGLARVEARALAGVSG